jgi:hypothetical protein
MTDGNHLRNLRSSPFFSNLPMAGKPMPWEEGDSKVQVDQYTV